MGLCVRARCHDRCRGAEYQHQPDSLHHRLSPPIPPAGFGPGARLYRLQHKIVVSCRAVKPHARYRYAGLDPSDQDWKVAPPQSSWPSSSRPSQEAECCKYSRGPQIGCSSISVSTLSSIRLRPYAGCDGSACPDRRLHKTDFQDAGLPARHGPALLLCRPSVAAPRGHRWPAQRPAMTKKRVLPPDFPAPDFPATVKMLQLEI